MYAINFKKIIPTDQKGYSLIQICIGLLIIGLLSAPFMGIWALKEKEKRYVSTSENIDNAISQIQGFVKRNGYFPCPAPLTADRDDTSSGYGAEAGATAAECRGAPFNALTPGNCLDGICIEQSVRTDIANRRIIVGAVPFRMLQMNERDTYDAYRGRLVYAVTESMTDPTTYNETNGGIAIRDEAGNSLVHMDGGAVDGSGAFVVLSHGPTQTGAYNSSGALLRPCAGGSLDSENCNAGFQSGSAVSADSVYISAFQSSANNAGFFDDFINYFSETVEPRWKYNQANEEGIETIPGNLVGIGTSAPTAELDIRSSSTTNPSLRVYGQNGTDGKILTDQLCDETGTNCFQPELLGGSPGIVCGTGTYMTGIESGSAACAPIAVECPAATPIMTGINSVTKAPICSAVPSASCAATALSVCNTNDVSLPLTGSGIISSTYNIGACRSVRYRCNAGTWALYSSSGLCTYTPPAPTVTSGISCGTGYTGTYTSTTTATCSGGTTTTNTRSTDCTCTGATVPQTTSCASLLGSNYTGTATRTVTYTPPSCTTSTSAWDTSSCTCGGTVGATRNVPSGSCPSGYTGSITKEQVFDGPSCNWVDTGNTTNTCTCAGTVGATRNVPSGSCPSGYTGSITKQQVFDGPSCNWVDTGTVNNTCTCNTTPTTVWRDHACSDTICEEPNPADRDSFTINIDPSTCTALPEQPATVGSCRSIGFKWQEVEDAGTNASSYPSDPNFVGSSCSCQDHKDAIGGAKKTCFYSSDGSKHIYRCKCL